MKIQIVLGSTRPGRVGEAVAAWAYENLKESGLADFELVDIADYDLPLLDEPMPPMMNQYTKVHTKKWSEKIAAADGYLFVTSEYNHGVPGAFKNAVDFLNVEWADKAIGFISYGSNGGSRAVEQWRGIVAELHLADVREQLLLSLTADFEDYSVFTPQDSRVDQLHTVASAVAGWAGALKSFRESKARAAT